MKLHERVREARQQLKASQEALAVQVGVTRGAVAQWEMPTGTAPSVENLIKVASVTGVAFEWLATGRGPKIHGHLLGTGEQRATYVAAALDPVEEALRAAVMRLSQSKKKALLELLTR